MSTLFNNKKAFAATVYALQQDPDAPWLAVSNSLRTAWVMTWDEDEGTTLENLRVLLDRYGLGTLTTDKANKADSWFIKLTPTGGIMTDMMNGQTRRNYKIDIPRSTFDPKDPDLSDGGERQAEGEQRAKSGLLAA